MPFIPYASTFSVTLASRFIKVVDCEQCKCQFVILIERRTVGQGTSVLWLDNQGAKERARKVAEKSLEKSLRTAIEPVACPDCGWYQQEMHGTLNSRRLNWLIPCAISIPFLLWLLVEILVRRPPWWLSWGCFALGAGLLLLRIILPIILNPNSNWQGTESSKLPKADPPVEGLVSSKVRGRGPNRFFAMTMADYQETPDLLLPSPQLHHHAINSIILALLPFIGLPLAIYSLAAIHRSNGRLRGTSFVRFAILVNVLVILIICLVVAKQE